MFARIVMDAGRPSSQIMRFACGLLIGHAVRHQLPIQRVHELVDLHGIQAQRLVVDRAGPALQKRRCGDPFFVVGVRPHAGCIVQGKSPVFAGIGARLVLVFVLVMQPAPGARQVDGRALLRKRRGRSTNAESTSKPRTVFN